MFEMLYNFFIGLQLFDECLTSCNVLKLRVRDRRFAVF